jgi:hypothetical protein
MTRRRLVFENPEALKIVNDKEEYVLYYGKEPVKTLYGRIISHKSQYLIQRIKEDIRPCFEDGAKENIIDTYLPEDERNSSSGHPEMSFYFDGWAFDMLSMQKEEIERDCGPLEENWEKSITSDRMLYLDETKRKTPYVQSILSWLHECNCELPDLWSKLGEKSAKEIGIAIDKGDSMFELQYVLEKYDELIPKPDARFMETLKNIYLKLSPEERVFVSTCHYENGDVIYPIAIALKKANLNEYSFIYPRVECNIRKQFKYIHFSELDDRIEKIMNEIKRGESVRCEFKSTLRWNIQANKIDKTMTHDCLKTIAGFLNTDGGGNLYIGVSDNGEILGLNHDKYKNDDEFLRSLLSFVDTSLGKYSTTLIDPEVIEIDNKKVCRIICIKGPKPTYMKWEKEEKFFIRTGPSTRSLPISEVSEYVGLHFDSKP